MPAESTEEKSSSARRHWVKNAHRSPWGIRERRCAQAVFDIEVAWRERALERTEIRPWAGNAA